MISGVKMNYNNKIREFIIEWRFLLVFLSIASVEIFVLYILPNIRSIK